ncbi:MAG: hypothetical protein LBB89_05660 [Treponema sp.]|nr:hypothetical protein [Treponema sp.]
MTNKKSDHGLSFTATYEKISRVLRTKVMVESATDSGIKGIIPQGKPCTPAAYGGFPRQAAGY